jgi:predicted 3-demethylubiquinone-9 3-methyltransferase (glyoxalase superfamily)
MPHKKRPLDRDSGVVRDASLLVIACEDTHAVKQYWTKRLRRGREERFGWVMRDGRALDADEL